MRRRDRALCLSLSLCLPFGDPDDLKRRFDDWIEQPHSDQVQAQHAQERIEQGMEKLGWIAGTPDGGKSKQADKVVDAPLKVLDFAGSEFGVYLHIRTLWRIPGLCESDVEYGCQAAAIAAGAGRSLVAIITKSAREPAFIFCITLPRCAFTVISLIPSSPPICLFKRPETTKAIT